MLPSIAPKPVRLELPHATLLGDLVVPLRAPGIVVFSHGSGSSRLSPRNQHVAKQLQQAGFGTLLFDLLTPEEDRAFEARFDIDLLTRRLVGAASWLRREQRLHDLRLGFFGASTGAAAAFNAAAELGTRVGAVISRGGRPDLALPAISRVQASTLLIVGGQDWPVLGANERALADLPGPKQLHVVPGASHLFEEPGTLDEVAELAVDWCQQHLS
ncbi:dienelactone hydrolase family protein [Hymenobacter sp. 15J16-1T3B]|uniref:dienelactone hydrolase family protein n=1 Tax=Hymenobacter sp. 15J16-1T3B TaxID=2886941 RepID=UPI001D112F21|nr:dienelactone hydrolase family protein [Hymenobacter sp. 15J16-1T3B]MCC3158030.1 dienelactone hydrolase family protein [Hymenobacter sp. 15J16-1T3B]